MSYVSVPLPARVIDRIAMLGVFLLMCTLPGVSVAMTDEIERSESGNPIYRHSEKQREWQAPEHSGRNLESVEEHLKQHIGEVETVFHEILSDRVHLDVLFIPAGDERPYHTLVTSGVSDLPMTVPEGMENMDRVELLIALPASWSISDESFKDESNYWPVRWLKSIGRLPHDYDTWIGWGHTIPNGDPPEPIADTPFIGFMLSPPYWLSPDFFQLEAASGDTVTFYNLVPLYEEEMALKLKKGADELEERLEKGDAGFVVNPERANVGKSGGWRSWFR